MRTCSGDDGGPCVPGPDGAVATAAEASALRAANVQFLDAMKCAASSRATQYHARNMIDAGQTHL